MSPPIRDGSSSSIGSIRLGDGSEISEVRTGAGDVLFSATPASARLRYSFDDADTSSGTITDSFGSFDGALNGNITTGVTGLASYNSGEAYQFDGNGDFVAANSTPSWVATNSDQSWAVWVNISSGASSGQILSHEDLTGSNDSRAGYYYNGSEIEAPVFDGSSTAGQAVSVSTGTTNHLVLTYDSATHSATLYVNNSKTTGSPSPRFTGSTGFTIAARPGGGNELQCTVDDARLYNKELTSTEVNNLFNSGSI